MECWWIRKKSNFLQFVIPAKAGIQIHMFLVPCIRRDNVWTPAGVYPVVEQGRGNGFRTFYETINVGILECWGKGLGWAHTI